MTNPTLAAAIFLWRRGEPVPVDLVMRLAAQGYDVPRLETRYAQ